MSKDTAINAKIDKFTFFGSIVFILAIVIPLLLFPEHGKAWVAEIRRVVTNNFGWGYLLFGVLAVLFVIYISSSDIGLIKLGNPEDKPEFSTLSWASMMFCCGIGASVLYWGVLEWVYYYKGPPFDLKSGTPQAIEWASTYGLFHWGPMAWVIYIVPAISIAYFSFVRKSPILKISQSLMPLLGEKFTKSNWGRLVDIFFIFGMIGGGATTLGFATPLITEGLHELFGTPVNLTMQLFVLLFTTVIFGFSAWRGLKEGIQKLSNINVFIAFIFLVFVLLVGATTFILNVGIESFGRSISNFITMTTWTEAFGGFNNVGFEKTNFPQDWTIFYWAWWLVYAPTVGLFIAKISRGRTIRQMTVGGVFYGTLGNILFFIILGNYGLYLQLTGSLDVVHTLDTQGATATIYAILNTLPIAKVAIAVFTVLAIIFTATTFDSISYILASVVQHEVDDEPKRWNRLFWAFTLSITPAILMFIGDLSTLQTASIFAGAPLIIIMTLVMISIVKAATYDLHYQPDYEVSTIHIEEVPEVAPWEEGETSEAPEGSEHAKQASYQELREEKSNKSNRSS